MSGDSSSAGGSGSRGRRKSLIVVSASGARRRFLRGMITHDLVQRGLAFDDAYAVASAVRDQLSDRSEIETAEIRDRVERTVEESFGSDALRQPDGRPASESITVVYGGQPQPFSRGLLARSIHAAGIDMDRAYGTVIETEKRLLRDGSRSISSNDLARRIAESLEQADGKEAARRYRLMRRIHRLPRPVVIYVGGASGTGKSSLALELAPLLRIYRINATDTIRQVMRMIFTPAILPALHSSSFEPADPQEIHQVDDDDGSLEGSRTASLVATFEEQATRVSVGIRAVVERAMTENMSVIVEGVHVHPGMVPFADLEGAVYQVPLMLCTMDPETHRSRFLVRASQGGRRADRYIENFEAIRVVHDHLLHHAEATDCPIVDTSDGDLPVVPCLRLVTGMLQRNLPGAGLDEGLKPSAPTLLLAIDGLADRPVRSLGERTPLEAAKTPNLDRLAREGQCGLADPVSPSIVADTASGSLALLGQSPRALARGPVEALGAGLELEPGDIALRANLATLDENGWIQDRRAGRIREGVVELARALGKVQLPRKYRKNVEIKVAAGTEHRLAIVLRGPDLSPAVSGSDPGDGPGSKPPLTPRAVDPMNLSAVRTAEILAAFEEAARPILAEHGVNRKRAKKGLPPANAILTRGAGRVHRLPTLERHGIPMRLVCISGDKTILGLAAMIGARELTDDSMTANLDTDLDAKFSAAARELPNNDLVFLHVKGADIAAHDRRPDLKVAFLERLDAALGRLLKDFKGPLRIAVAGDHATLSELGQHGADPLPVLIHGEGVSADSVQSYGERAAAGGQLGRFRLQTLMARIFDLS